MRLKTLWLVAVLTCAVLALSRPWALADDKKEDKSALSGAWVRSGAELKIEFPDKNTIHIAPHGDDALILIVGQSQLGKDGRVKVKVTALQGKEEVTKAVQEHVPIGLEFSFRWQAKDDAATLDELKADNADVLKGHLEGKYERKK
jgi:hypothetical protein